MRALAHRGGAATKRGASPGYFRMIGRLGGQACVASRKRRILAEIEGRVFDDRHSEFKASPEPEVLQTGAAPLTLADILGEEEMLRTRGAQCPQ